MNQKIVIGFMLTLVGLIIGGFGFFLCHVECINGGCLDGLRLNLICFFGAMALGLILIAIGMRIVQRNY